MKKNLLFIFFLFNLSIIFAQKTGKVLGEAYDSSAKLSVQNATISILNASDSSLVSFSMTNEYGKFEITNLPKGKYSLIINHVSYNTFNGNFIITDTLMNFDFGTIFLLDKAKYLNEVIVSSTPPVTIINDTIQYHAGAFKTPPNSSVEQLLKKMPGLKIAKDGSVEANGKKVTKLLVDGKTFFGNDVTIATKNLPADAIDKVQVFEKLSEQAELTGFDDGNGDLTINLKLKKEKKGGWFGRIMGGGGTNERYEAKGALNLFKENTQVNLLGMGNNINSDGFGFTDMLEATTLGSSNGIRESQGLGVNYNDQWAKQHSWQSSYFYNNYNPKQNTKIFRENFIKNTRNFYTENSTANNFNTNHKANVNYNFDIDSFHSIRVTPSINFQNTTTNTQRVYDTRDTLGNYINNGWANNTSENQGYGLNNTVLFRKKFRKGGRTISLSVQNGFNNNNGLGHQQSLLNSYDSTNTIYKTDSINQVYTSSSENKSYNARVVYTEPLWKKSQLEFSIAQSGNSSTSNKITNSFNNVTGKFDVLNARQSNSYLNEYENTNAGIRIRKQDKTYNYAIGLNAQIATLTGKVTIAGKDTILTQSFKNLLPTASFKYNFTKLKSFNANYKTSTRQPSLSQLQPVPDNTNPLYVREGNPDLKQEFKHDINSTLNWVNAFTSRNLFIRFNASLTENKITNYDSVDAKSTKRTSKPININGVYSWGGNISYSFPLKPIKTTIELRGDVNFNNNIQFINSTQNIIKTLNTSPSIKISTSPIEAIDIDLVADLNFNNATATAQPNQNIKYTVQEYNADINVQLPFNMQLASGLAYVVNNNLSDQYNIKIPLWNAAVSKLLLKNRLEIKLRINDVLNRNVGITRTINNSYIEDRQTNTLQRYFMLSATFNLNKMGLPQQRKGGYRA